MKLYRLAPLGEGTPEIESFPSYMYRLAAIHGVSLNQLLELSQRDYKKQCVSENYDVKTSCIPWSFFSMVSPTDVTHDIVRLVTKLTGQDGLRCTTFLALRKMRYRSSNLFTQVAKWCPVCIKDNLDNGNPAYLRLLWHLSEVDCCHLHNVKMELRCPHCDSSQNARGCTFSLECCQYCEESLVSGIKPNLSMQLSNSVLYKDMLDLVTEISADSSLEFDPMAWSELLEKIVGNVSEIKNEKDFWALIPKNQSVRMIHMNKPVTVKMLRRVAYRLGIGLPGLLNGDTESWTAQLDPKWLQELPNNLKPLKKTQRIDREDVLIRLSAILKASCTAEPPSLARAALLVGVSTGGLEYLFPDHCRIIKDRYKSWVSQEQNRKLLEAAKHAMAYLNNDYEFKSRKNALKVIREETGLPKNMLRHAINKEFELRGYS